jgi:uncharacterized protein YjbJ (UPF0337 family)
MFNEANMTIAVRIACRSSMGRPVSANQVTGYSVTVTKERTVISSTEDKTKGKFHEIKGKVKEEVGKLTNSPELEAEGKNEKNAGKFQKKVGEIKKVFGE